MERKSCIATVVFFSLLLLVQGCETTSNFQIVNGKMRSGLDSCLGKLTKDALIMRASTPTEKIPVDNGEIWIYKYRKSEVETTATGNGSLLFPVQAESKTHDYALDVKLRFNKEGVLVDWSYDGSITAFDHPFADLQC